MQYRQFYRLATLTAFVLFTHTATTYAQRARNTVITENLESGQISGKVTTETGAPEGIRVILTYKGKTIAEVVTAAAGTYEFKALSPGKYDLSLFKTGFRKRIINEVPVVEKFNTTSTIKLNEINYWHEERKPNIMYYEELKEHKIEKL